MQQEMKPKTFLKELIYSLEHVLSYIKKLHPADKKADVKAMRSIREMHAYQNFIVKDFYKADWEWEKKHE